MLDKNKIIKELQNIVLSSFANKDKELEFLEFCFRSLIKSEIINLDKFNIIFTDPIDTAINVNQYNRAYAILAVDGSQIYPDRHQGMTCHVINIGWSKIVYNSECFFTEFKSVPSVFNNLNAQDLLEDTIDSQRTELEFKVALTQSIEFKNLFKDIPFLCLFDGSLMFWHLENKNPEIKYRYLTSYFTLLEQFYKEKIFIASLISMPKNRDIINFINYCLANKIIPNLVDTNYSFKYVCDEDLLLLFLKPLNRSGIMNYNNSSSVLTGYPEHLRPCFIYINLDQEIVRVEFPAWIAKDLLSLNIILDIILDQCSKGQGYPVVLAEAHEQAVIKNSDREFFYQMLYKISIEQHKNIQYSRKSLKKRMVAV